MNTELDLPTGLLDSLALTRPPRLLVLRHGDREAIAPGDSGELTPLTPLGELRTAALLHELGQAPDWGLSSPLLRCMRTADLLGVCADPSALLGAPGAFVTDSQRAAKVFAEHGTQTTLRQQLTGETWGCMRTLEAGARALLDDWLAHLRARRGTGVAVSHDTILMPVITKITGERFVDDWLAPLDGAVLTPAHFFWRGQRIELSA